MYQHHPMLGAKLGSNYVPQFVKNYTDTWLAQVEAQVMSIVHVYQFSTLLLAVICMAVQGCPFVMLSSFDVCQVI